jgi:signal transduction histidine kinase/DNA-binding response OmpR family regulator
MMENIHILLVEDNPGDAFLIEDMLTAMKPGVFEIATEGRLSDGFARLDGGFPANLVLLDLNLPDSNGIETIRNFHKKVPKMPIVVITGLNDEATGLAAVQAGAQDFLVKGHIPGFHLVRVIEYAIERQQAREKLCESEIFLRSSLDALSSHIAIIDEKGNILTVNKAWLLFAEQNGADVNSVCENVNYLSTCTGITGPDARFADMFIEGFNQVIAGDNRQFWMEYPCHSPWEKRWFNCRITPFSQKGQPCVVVAHENITRSKTAEEALKNSELKLMTILDALAHQVILLDPDRCILWANRQTCVYSNRDRENIMGKMCYSLWPGQKDHCEECAVKESIKKGISFFKTMKSSDGRVWNVMACPVCNREGEIVSVVEVREDITEKQSIEEQFRHAQKMEAIGRLAGGVAHDFNNMLSIITGFGELSKSHISPENPIAENIEEILSAARRSADLTRHLLAFARKQVISPRVVDCNDIISNSLKMLKRIVGEDIEIGFIPANDPWMVKIDPTQIDQILTNLTVNSRDAIKNSQGWIFIETKNCMINEAFCRKYVYARPGQYVLIQVKDNGMGMDEYTMSRIFEPFYTTKAEGKGTGLGLSTVFGIVKQNNGFVNVSSEPDKGTTFSIYLPCHQGEVPSGAPEGVIEGKGGNEYVLIVEDEEKILKLCKKILTDKGYSVVGATSPSDAIDCVRSSEKPFDLLIVDVVMPIMTGPELKKQIERTTPGIKTLFISGYARSAMLDKGVLPENMNYIQKPFSPSALSMMVRNILDAG